MNEHTENETWETFEKVGGHPARLCEIIVSKQKLKIE